MKKNPAPARKKAPRSRLWVVGAAVLLLAYFGIAPRLRANRKLHSEVRAEQTREPLVSAVSLMRQAETKDLLLPGTVQAIEETSISARSNGYLSQRFVDIGSKVKAGQVLAIIDAPDLDQELSQAQADASRSVANGQQAIADVSRLQAAVSEAQAQLAASQSTLEEDRAEVTHMRAKLTQAKGTLAEADAKLVQAQRNLEGKQADYGRAKARLTLAEKTYKRWQLLAKGGAVSGQDLDETQEGYESSASAVTAAQADIDSAKADVVGAESNVQATKGDVAAAAADVASAEQKVSAAQSAVQSNKANISAARAAVEASQANVRASNAAIASSQANVGRVSTLRGFERVVAPFDGVITARNVDVGDLIAPPTGAHNGDQTNPVTANGLFSIARTDVLRIQVMVPEAYVSQISNGQPADISVAEYPGRWFQGRVFHSAGAVDASSRTELIEVRVENAIGELKPGMYSQVRFKGAATSAAVQIPATAMIFDANGTRVAEITRGDTIHFVKVTPGRDFGDKIEVLVGLKGDEKLVTNPDDSLQEGEHVQVATGTGA